MQVCSYAHRRLLPLSCFRFLTEWLDHFSFNCSRLLLNQMPSIVLSLSYYIIHPSTFTSSSLSSTFSYVYFDTNTENIEGPARHHPRNQIKNPPPQQHPQKHLSRKDPIPSPSRTRKKHKRHFKKSPSNKLNMQN